MNDSIKNPCEEQINKIWANYGCHEDFKKKFSEEKTKDQIIQNEEQVYISEKAPNLFLMEKAYGYPFVIHWLSLQLEEINTSSQGKLKMDISIVREYAKNIYLKYPRIKVSEIILFVFKMKCGEYEKFYAAVEPTAIMTSLSLFIRERNRFLADYHQKQEKARKQKEREEWAKGAVTREQYEEMKAKNIPIPYPKNKIFNK